VAASPALASATPASDATGSTVTFAIASAPSASMTATTTVLATGPAVNAPVVSSRLEQPLTTVAHARS
jgi:hypothetical protein